MLTKKANVICSAHVVSVEAPTELRNSFLIHLKVDDGLRGVQAGEEIVISEWSGRWQSGVDRWRTGDSYLLFLSPAKGSLAPANGEEGRLRLTRDMVTLPSNSRSERAMRLQKIGPQPVQVPYREIADQIRAAMREQQ